MTTYGDDWTVVVAADLLVCLVFKSVADFDSSCVVVDSNSIAST